MKTVLLLLILLGSIAAHAQEKYVVVKEDSSFLAQNGAQIEIHRGDCFPFSRQDNSKIFFTISGIGDISLAWNTVQIVNSSPEGIKRNQDSLQKINDQYAFEIPDDSSPYNKGGVMTDWRASERWKTAIANAEAAMNRVESMGFYGVAAKAIDLPSQGWHLELGDAFPFLGFQGDKARLGLGSKYLTVPREAVSILPVAQHPELATKYKEILATVMADKEAQAARAAASKQQQTLDQINRNLEQIKQLEQLRRLQGQ